MIFELMSRFLLSRYNTGTIVFLCTILSVILSLLIGILVIKLGNHYQCSGILITMHIITPILVAPLVTFPYIKSVYEIDLLRKKLNALARIDELTQISNRRFFNEQARHIISRARRTLEPVSLMFIDIDYFKRINDNHGHDAGDKSLRAVAELLKSQVREYDIVGRYGGEEFLMLLPNTGLETAEKIAERIRKTIENADIDTGKERLRLTVSIGLANRKGVDLALDELVASADNGVYRAKESGRNTVKIAAA